MSWSRRGLLAAGLGSALVPRLARSASAGIEHRFVFLLCRGGWDTSLVFASHAHASTAESADDGEPAALGDLRFVDGSQRPSVRAFFEDHGDRTCIVNGIEVRSIAHLRCRQLVLTGSSAAADDWPTTIAARSEQHYLLPHVVISGPSFARDHVSAVARVGGANQLAELVDGTALSSAGHAPPSREAEDLIDAWVRERASAYAAAAPAGGPDRFGALYEAALDDLVRIKSGSIPDFEMVWSGCGRDLLTDLRTGFDALEQDLARCVTHEFTGVCGQTWDSHDANDAQQSNHYEALFATLSAALDDLDGRTASDGSALADHVTLVVFSEMGRHPRYNAQLGRDHWTWTSAMPVGAGVQGGRTIGAVDDDCQGVAIDLSDGGSGGTTLLPEHLGSTLFTLAGLDGQELTGVPPLSAVLA